MWKVKYWDGSREPETFKTRTEAVTAAKQGLKDWMNDDDGYHVHAEPMEDVAYVWVTAGSEGDTDAMATIYAG